jgi:acetyl esterase/lipase
MILKQTVIILCCIFLRSIAISQDLVLPLYTGPIPNAKKTPADYIEQTDSSGLIENVSVPTIAAYLPDKSKANGTAVIIFSGGGYFLNAPKNCIQIALAFKERGVAAFFVKYRLPNDRIMLDKTIGPLQDAQTAIKMVREKSAEWNIDPKKIGMIGLSAGGHLVSTEGTQLNRVVIENNNKTSLKPDFMVLIYPVIIYDRLVPRSRENLIGKNASAQALHLYSTDKHVNRNTPRTFLVHAADDDVIPVKNSLRFFDAMLKAKVPGELHILQTGAHGFGIYENEKLSSWFSACLVWLNKNGFLPESK